MAKIYAAKDPGVTRREKDNAALSRLLAGECAVLLENDGALPVKAGKVALYGSGARHTVKGGTGSGDVNVRSSVNIEQGLLDAGFEVLTGDWLDRQDAYHEEKHAEYLAWVPVAAKEQNTSEFYIMFSNHFNIPAPVAIGEGDLFADETDTAIFIISRTSGEGADRRKVRGDYYLYEEEKNALERLAEVYKKIIIVLNVGGVIDMSEIRAIGGTKAVLLMSQLGNLGGSALADVLTGRVNPSGKLTDTWAKRYEDYPAAAAFGMNDGNVNDEYYTEGIYVGYRYFDSFGVEPEYPFGYGKSYTTFGLGGATVNIEGERITVSVPVTNTGGAAGKEVVQVYYSAPAGGLRKPYQELAGYKKTGELAPGATENVEISFSVRDMASYCEECAAWVLERGDYVIRVGTSSRETVPAAVLELGETVRTEQLKNVFAGESFEEIAAPEIRNEAPRDAERITIDAAAIKIVTAEYSGERRPYTTDKTKMLTAEDVLSGYCTVEELVSQLTTEELAELCVGSRRAERGSIVGDSSNTVPGAAGDTSHIIAASRGVKGLITADGPAGLRLQPVFKTDKEGRILPGGNVLGDSYVPFDPKYTDENSDTYYQYCTAIPIGWALAQSWNTELLEKIGSMVGGEMELFGVDLWLAPALNIHRDPLCGRNFEYYSEDPLISGRSAAAITRGVQSHAGKGTTIKHLAFNNQEDNRYYTNSHVHERAAREIYLRGFEIAVRESQPMSVMTSYNLINGEHTANSYELIQTVLRDEWGFEGFVMTDWFTSQEHSNLTGENTSPYPISASTGCVKSGNDVQMPGGEGNVEDIIRAVTSGEELDGYRLTLADVQFCAANVIKTALKCLKTE